MRVSKIALVLIAAAFVCPAAAQSTVYVDDFESGGPGWTFDPAVGPAPGCQWGVDGTPAAPFSIYACGGTFGGGEATVAAGVGALNWNDGTAMQFGSGTAVPFDNSATSPAINLTTLTGVTLTFDDYYEMNSCSDDFVAPGEGNHRRFIDIVDATTGTVIDSLVLAFTDGSVDVDTNWVSCDDGTLTSWSYHHPHTIALDTLPGLSVATLPVNFRLRMRVNISSYMGDIGAGSDVEDGSVGWFVDDIAINCPSADATVPSLPVQITPAAASIQISPVFFDWTDATDTAPCSAGTVTYEVRIIPVAPAGPAVFFPAIPSNLTQALGPGSYNWAVRSIDGAGNTSGFTGSVPFDVEINLPPLAPDTLFVNESADTAQGGDPGFVDPITDQTPVFSAIYRDANLTPDSAAGLRFQVSTDPTFTVIDFDSGPLGISPVIPTDARSLDLTTNVSLLRDTVYFWRIQFTDFGGLTGPFSLNQSFRIGDDFEFGVRHGSTHHGKRCWIATAAWGSETAAPVSALQDFRFSTLESAAAGRAASRTYHTVGAVAASTVGSSALARFATSGSSGSLFLTLAATGLLVALAGCGRLFRAS